VDASGNLLYGPVPYAASAANATNATNATNAGNADTLDGQHAAAFALVDHTHPLTTQPAGNVRAWANFGSGGPVIKKTFNVSSVTELSGGHYNMNFAVGTPDGSYGYSVLAGCGPGGVLGNNTPFSAQPTANTLNLAVCTVASPPQLYAAPNYSAAIFY
jgi:hypothetical protein